MAKKLFKSNITALEKVRNTLHNSQNMNGGQIILSNTNENCRASAEIHINRAISYLNLIE